MSACPCGSGRDYDACCGRYHQGDAAPTAEALMRSRYSAFVLGLEGYLRESWHPQSCPEVLQLDPQQCWLGLAIRACEGGGATDQEGVVEFVARSKRDGRASRLHERSRFVRVAGRWRYLDGEIIPAKSRRR